jgi:hypothetical protein
MDRHQMYNSQAPDVQQQCAAVAVKMDGVQVQRIVLVIVDGKAPHAQGVYLVHSFQLYKN